MPATLHVIFGPCGAGKTTYAHALARREGAVPFVLDDWGARLFGPDVDGPIDFRWMLERLGRCEAQILLTAADVLAVGTPVVLDIGAMRRANRDRIRQIAQAKDDIRSLQTEFSTRANLAQLERWNGDVLALTAPTAGQYMASGQQLASLGGEIPGGAQVQMASLVIPTLPVIATPADDAQPAADPAPVKTSAPVMMASAKPAPAPAPAKVEVASAKSAPDPLAAIVRAAAAHPARAIAFIAGFGYTGLLVGPPVVGWLGQALTLRGALVLLVVLTALVALLAPLLRGGQPGLVEVPAEVQREAPLLP